MKISQSVSHIDEEASGPSYSVPRLCDALSANGQSVTLATLESRGKSRSFSKFQHVQFANIGKPQKLGISKQMKTWFSNNAVKFDIIHNHGLWMMPNIYPALAAKRSGVPYIISPRGTMSVAAMKYSPKIKSVFWFFKQKTALGSASGFHATSEDEYADIRRAGFMQPVAIIPNGIDIGPIVPTRNESQTRTLLSLGRIHPKKGLEMAINAWKQLQDTYREWNFQIVGKGDTHYISTLHRLIEEIGAHRIEILGPVYGEEKTELIRSAELFILPTRNENFGMVVAEALAESVPVITTRGAPWQGLRTEEAGWWVDIGIDPIKQAMKQAFELPPEILAERGANGRLWMARAFSWETIGQDMTVYYDWLINGGNVPEFVKI